MTYITENLAFSKLVKWQKDEVSAGIIVLGKTGEGATVTLEEYKKLVDLAIRMADKQMTIIVGELDTPLLA